MIHESANAVMTPHNKQPRISEASVTNTFLSLSQACKSGCVCREPDFYLFHAFHSKTSSYTEMLFPWWMAKVLEGE